MTSSTAGAGAGSGGPTPYVQVYRPGFARALGGTLVALAVAVVVLLVITGGPDALLRYTGGVALVGLVGYLGYWRPHVLVDEHGVEVRNPLRSVRVPWTALLLVDGRYGLRLVTAEGRYDAWAAPAPTGMARARHQTSACATMVTRRWERETGLADPAGRARAADAPVGAWDRDEAATGAAAVLAALAVLGPLLALLV
ncbi:PH domain-containing protein [Nocardioides sp. CPCC 205120]|uniref:PH domain-containing protein n=1 Tax=Nocardioides sp. CPCC 205120 TaxID=3406462 RepID=UPI003B51350C